MKNLSFLAAQVSPSGAQQITGEWSFIIADGKEFLVTDDETLDAYTKLFGIFDHHVLWPTARRAMLSVQNAGIDATVVHQVDDTGAGNSYDGLSNSNGNCQITQSLLANGATEIDINADTVNFRANGAVLLGNGYQVASYTYGSNANGRWQKWWDKDGNVIRVEQTTIAAVINGAYSVPLPVAMPDVNYQSILTETWESATQRFITQIKANDTTTTAGVYGTNYTGGAAFCNFTGVFIWVKS